MDELYFLAEGALDVAMLEEKFLFKMYDYLKHNKAKRNDATEFLNSSTAGNIGQTIIDLNEYIKGGQDNEHKQIREAYHHKPKTHPRKIVKYLNTIIDDAERYEYDKRPGRRKKRDSK